MEAWDQGHVRLHLPHHLPYVDIAGRTPQPESTLLSACRPDVALYPKLMSHLHQVMPRNGIAGGDLWNRGHIFSPNREVDQQPKRVVGVNREPQEFINDDF